MNLHEFELRYKAYDGLNTRYDLNMTDQQVMSLVKKSTKGKLEKKVIDSSLDELWSATRETYSTAKKEAIASGNQIIQDDKDLATYIERLEYELKVIDEMGYNTYFLIVQDYIQRAREHNIVVGPGRGSVAGSLLSFVIGITDIDPLTYDLIFERFLNPGRISMPDIDTDFEDTQRDRVIEYISDKYGAEKVAHIGTYMTLAARAAFKDVARVIGLPFLQSNKMSTLITGKSIEASLKENKDFAEAVQSEDRIKNIVRIAQQMEGTVRQTGVHACGMIIAPEPVVTYSPIQHPPKSGSKQVRDESRVVSQYDGHVIEDIGLLKMDLLGLRNLSIIKNCIKIINAKSKKDKTEIDPMFQDFMDTMYFHPPLEDQQTYIKIFHQGDTSGVFQFESDGMKNWLKKLKPTDFNDLIAMVALYRPGPMEFIPHYIDRKHGAEKVSYMDPELRSELVQTYDEATAAEEEKKLVEDLAPFMDITFGIAVYQEQLMRLVQSMAGFSMSEADKLRKGVGKKIREVIEKIKVEFIDKSAHHRGYKKETAVWVYEKMIEPAADYSFNKSHAACYAYISFQTAYLKAHFPIEFNAALLRSVEEETDKLAKFIDELKLQGYKIKLPDVNNSFEHVAAVDDAILLGFLAIKGIGSDIAEFIEAERSKAGNFTSLTDFLKRCSSVINKKSLEALIKAGALDIFEDRITLLTNSGQILDWVKSMDDHQQMGGGLFAMQDVEGHDLSLTGPDHTPQLLEYLSTEYEVFKSLLSAHPFDGLYSYLKQQYNFLSVVRNTESFGEFNIFGMIKAVNRGMRGGFFIKVEDISGEMEFYIKEKLDLEVFDIVTIKGYKGHRSPKIDKIIVHDLQQLIDKLKKVGQYKEQETVDAVRKERFAPIIEDTTTPQKEMTPLPPAGMIEEAETPIGNTQSSDGTTTFQTPDNISVLAKIPVIIKSHPGDTKVRIGDLEAQVDQQGLAQISELLSS